ncbi:MAG: MATE family efflux transporter [Polyangiaceae bacterium]|nr:MATE family efflux transporter [Polyangiaceae bacterium]
MSQTQVAAVTDDFAAADESAERGHVVDGPVLSTIVRLATPTVLVLVAQSLVGVAETWYVSFLGGDALAGASLVFPIIMLMTMMSNGGLGSGVASAVARALGAGRREDANALVWHAVVLAIGAGIVFAVAAWLLGPALYRGLGGSGGALDAAVSYSHILFAGSIPIWIVNLLAAALRGAGDVRTPAKVTLVGSAIVVAASPALIFGLGPIPAMGIAGAGLATVLFYVGASAYLLRRLRREGLAVRLVRSRIDARLLGDVMRVGLPAAASTIQPNLTVIVVTGAVGAFGIQAIAGYGMASRLDYLLVPVLFGLGSAVLTMVGMSVGARAFERARRIAWTGAALGFAIAGGVGLIAAFAPTLWLNTFSSDPALVEPGVSYLRRVAPAYGLFGAGFVLSFASQGAARVLWPFLAGTARLVIAAGLGWLAVHYLDASMSTLFAIVGGSLVAFFAVIATALSAGTTLRRAPEGKNF